VEGTGTRGRARQDAILLAAVQLLAEVGYDRMTMDAVADRARASKATIYRRWPGKPELVVAALEQLAPPAATALPDTGSLRADLVAVLDGMRAGLMAQDAAVVLGLLTAMRNEPRLADVVRQRFLDVKGAAFDAVLARAVAAGTLAPTTDRALLAEVGSALLFSRLFITGAPLDTAVVEHLVAAVLLPLIDHHRTDRKA
jgi:AcrR family transcriptional regulator